MTTINQPQWKHDCDTCAFLGTFNEYDLYFCEQGGLTPTLIARFGDKGNEYWSGMECGKDSPPGHPLQEAYQRAVQTLLIAEPHEKS